MMERESSIKRLDNWWKKKRWWKRRRNGSGI